MMFRLSSVLRTSTATAAAARTLAVRNYSVTAATYATAADVKELRRISAAPMMDCKKALEAEGGNMEAALKWLRSKGISKIASAERVATEGLICMAATPDSAFYTLVEVNSETDFVSMNGDFLRFMSAVAGTASSQFGTTCGAIPLDALLKAPVAVSGGKTVEESLGDLVSVIRENIVVTRAFNVFPPVGGVLAGYVHGKVALPADIPAHMQMGKQAAVISIGLGEEGSTAAAAVSAEVTEQVRDMARKLAMHAVAAKPLYLDMHSVPSTVLESEHAVFAEQTRLDPKNSTKKPEMVEKIVAGKVAKRLAEVTLLGQAHVAEEGGPVVEKFVKQFGVTVGTAVRVDSFALWSVGNSIPSSSEPASSS